MVVRLGVNVNDWLVGLFFLFMLTCLLTGFVILTTMPLYFILSENVVFAVRGSIFAVIVIWFVIQCIKISRETL